jgi:hypothetical protein
VAVYILISLTVVRSRIVLDAVEGVAEVIGQGSAAVKVWIPAWMSMVL